MKIQLNALNKRLYEKTRQKVKEAINEVIKEALPNSIPLQLTATTSRFSLEIDEMVRIDINYLLIKRALNLRLHDQFDLISLLNDFLGQENKG